VEARIIIALVAGYLLGSVSSFYFLGRLLKESITLFHPVSVLILVSGALAATFINAFPTGVDNNLMVPLISAVVMMIFSLPGF